MQLKIWIDDDNWLTIDLKLSETRISGSENGPEVIAAFVSDKKLSHIEIDEVFDIAGQAIDHLTAIVDTTPTKNDDWRDKFRRGEL